MNCKPINFTGTEMKVELTNLCRDGRCTFCSPLIRPAVVEAGQEVFLQRFTDNLDLYLEGGGRKVILTGGGEPTDAPGKLFGALRQVRERTEELGVELELLAVYTNAVKLLRPIMGCGGQTFLDRLAEMGLKDLNLSVHGLTRKQKVVISGEAMASVDFETLIPAIVRKGIRVMTRTVLADGFIDSIQQIEEFVSWAAGLGVGICYFSDMFQLPVRNEQTTPGSKTVMQWTDDHRTPFDGLIADVRRSNAFVFVSEFTRHNAQGRTFEFRHGESGIRVMFGDLAIGNESEDQATYGYMKPDGSMDVHNNARDANKREFVPLEEMKAYLQMYRPGRGDL
jgi:hypothetical protein